MQRVVIQICSVSNFHNFSKVHNGNLMAYMAYNRKIVCNKDIGNAEFFLKPLKQINYLRLNGDIQSRDRLIADNQLGIAGKGARNTKALSLPTTHFMRVTITESGIQLNRS